MRSTKIQDFTEKYAEHSTTKTRPFKLALHEAQEWQKTGSITLSTTDNDNHYDINTNATSPATTFVSTSVEAEPSRTFHTQPDVLPTPPISIFKPNFSDRDVLTSTPPLPPELEKTWEDVEVDEDFIDGFIVISSEKDMHPLVSFYNEHKRKMEQNVINAAKRAKTEIHSQTPSAPTSSPVSSKSTSGSSSTAATQNSNTNPVINAQNSKTIGTPIQQVAHNSAGKQHSAKHKLDLPRHQFMGEATNGFSTAPLGGTLEGEMDDGFLVEFTVQGRSYSGFLLARDSFPSSITPISPLLPSPLAGTIPHAPGFNYANLTKMTAAAVGKQHTERLFELGKLVVASAMVPYTFPPTLH